MVTNIHSITPAIEYSEIINNFTLSDRHGICTEGKRGMKKLIWSLKYAWLTIKHKYFVFLAGRKIGCSYWRLLVHDLSKFLPCELWHYGRQFFGDQGDPLGFSYAWLHHQRSNKHHWEAWIPVTGHNRGGYKDLDPLPMPSKYALEMVADFLGASRAYEGKWPTIDNWAWYRDNFPKIKLHIDTQKTVEATINKALNPITNLEVM